MRALFASDSLRILVPALSLVVLLGAVFYIQPRTMSYLGLNLMLNLAVPVAPLGSIAVTVAVYVPADV